MKTVIFAVCLLILLLLPFCIFAQETLAVLDFTTEAVSKIEMKTIVEYLSSELFNTNKYIVIDVSQREAILDEMSFSMSGCADDTCALEIGKMLSAEYIVTGTLSKIGSRYLMSIKMLETETSKTVRTSNGKYANLDELIDGLEKIAYEMAGVEDKKTVAEPEKVEEPPAAAAMTERRTAVEPAAPAPEPTPAETPVTKKEKVSKPKGEGALVPAIVCTAAGAGGLVVGGYFLFSLFTSTLPAYNDATTAYNDAGLGADFDTLFAAREVAYDAAFKDMLIGGIAAGAGAVLTTIGILLFPPGDSETGTNVSLVPSVTGSPGLVVRVSY